MATTTQQTDPELQRIDDWIAWFRSAHAERLAALRDDGSLSLEQHAKEWAAIGALADAIDAKLREDWQRRYQP
jgi:hypothetical protein